MASNERRVLVRIDGNASGFAREMERARNEAAAGTAALSKLAGAFTSGLAASAAGLSITAIVGDIASEIEKVERNLLRTQALLKSTGYVAGLTAGQLREQARELALNTLESTEGVQAAQQILLTFKSVSEDTFTRAIALASDLSTTIDGGLNGAVTQLGKALEDPVKGVSALSKAGVSFTESQKEMIRSLVETGDKAAAQTLILDELASQYGGIAKNEAMGLAGAQDTLGQRIQELKLEIGDLLALGDKLTAFYNAMANGVKRWSDALQTVELGAPLDQFDEGLMPGMTRFNAAIDKLENKLAVMRKNLSDPLSIAMNAGLDLLPFGETLDEQMSRYQAELETLKKQRKALFDETAAARSKARQVQTETAAATATEGLKLNPKLGGVGAELAANVQAMIESAARDGISIGITSGLRSTEKQAKLWAEALQKYGSAEEARKWVAPPGSSRHEKGQAVDLGVGAAGSSAWIAKNASRFGLQFPVSNESPGSNKGWVHAELMGSRDKASSAASGERKMQLEADRAATKLASEAQEEFNRVMAEGARVIEATRTPAEQLALTLDGLAELQRAGALAAGDGAAGMETYRRAIEQAHEDFHAQTDQMKTDVAEVDAAASELGWAFSSAFEDAILSGKKLSDVLMGLLEDIQRVLLRKLVLDQIANTASTLLGKVMPSIAVTPNADGGVMSALGPMPLRRYASGGVARSPQLALFGEGAKPEAYVPLPDGRSIPVTLGGAIGGGGSVTVNLYESATQAGQVKDHQDSGGARVIDIFVERIKASMSDDVASGRGSLSGALERVYGLNRAAGAM